MMKYADIDELQSMVTGIIKASPLAARFRSLTLESDGYDREDDFLRIQVFMSDPDSLGTDEVASLISSIEEAVTVRDDRFPSVRFPYS